MESTVEEHEDKLRSPVGDEEPDDITTTSTSDMSSTACPIAASSRTVTTTSVDQTEEEEEEEEGATVDSAEDDTQKEKKCSGAEEGQTFISSSDSPPAGSSQDSDQCPGGVEEDKIISSTPSSDRPAPPNSLLLSGSRPKKKKVLVAPALSLSLGDSESTEDDFPSTFLSLSPGDDDVTGLDIDLDAIETPSDSESVPFPIYDVEDDLRRLGVASRRRRGLGSSPRSRFDSQTGSRPGVDQMGLGPLEQEDTVDKHGTRWRCFTTGVPPQESWVNMSVLDLYLRVLSHGGYYGDGMNDIIVFSSCYLPENSLEHYQYVMDNLFRYVVGTLDLMVAENYVIVYFCAGGQKDRLPGISWLRECYTTIDRRLRKNLKGFYVVHPTWYIKALVTIIKPFISSKFSRKLQFVESLQDLSGVVPTEHVQIPDCVTQYDQNLSG